MTPGQSHEMKMAHELLSHAEGRALLADTAYDANSLVSAARRRGMKVVIPNRPERVRRTRRVLDRRLYRQRYLVEVFFHHLKRFRAIATRYDKTARNYLSLVQLACTWLWLGAI